MLSRPRRERVAQRPSRSCRSRSKTFFSRRSPRRGRMVWRKAWRDTRWRFALVLVPSLEIALLAPAVGEHYPLADALVHGALIFVLGGVFFALAMLVSSFVDDFGRSIVLTAVAGVVLAIAEAALPVGHGLFTG